MQLLDKMGTNWGNSSKYRVWWRDTDGKRQVEGSPRCRYEDNIEIYLKEAGWKGSLVSKVVNLGFQKNVGVL